jgi:Rps23 Pro-64 3,4-dihydroxylase Tpa1-like proline 4-hydroxylase
MLKGSAMAGSLFSALQPAQKETLRLPDFGRADDAMSIATAFSMNPALNEVEQARGKSQEAIRNMATTAGQYTSNMQSVNQRAGQQSAGLRVQEQQIMNQLAGQKAGYETQKASAIQQELARFDENTLMNKAATQDARVAFVENINNLGTEIMKQGNEQDIASEQDKLAVQNAKLKIIQSAFENPDVISGANLESILKMIEKGDYTNIPKLFGQTSDTRKTLKAEEARQAALQNNK